MGTVKESPSGQYVRYIGTADRREISKKDWKAVDLVHDAVVWDRSNNFTIPVEDISEDAWQHIEDDDTLVTVKADAAKELKLPSKHPAANVNEGIRSEQTASTEPVGGGAGSTGSATPAGGAVGGSTAGGRTR